MMDMSFYKLGLNGQNDWPMHVRESTENDYNGDRTLTEPS